MTENFEKKENQPKAKESVDLNDPSTVKSSAQLQQYMKNRPIGHQDVRGEWVDDGTIDIDIDKPLDQWTEDEKKAFLMVFNNFPELFPARGFVIPNTWGYGENIEKKIQLIEDAKAAFIRHGIETNEFKEKIKEYQECMRGGFNNLSEGERTQLWRDLLVYIEYYSLPAIFDLLDSGRGYSLTNLIR